MFRFAAFLSSQRAMSKASVEQLFDELIDGHAGFEYVVKSYAECSEQLPDENTILVEHLPLQPPQLKYTKVLNLIDVIDNWEKPNEVDFTTLSEQFKNGMDAASADSLPAGIRPASTMPDGTVFQCVIQKKGENQYIVVKHFNFQQAVKSTVAAPWLWARATNR